MCIEKNLKGHILQYLQQYIWVEEVLIILKLIFTYIS